MTDFDFFRYTLNVPRKCSPGVKTRGLNALRNFIKNYKAGKAELPEAFLAIDALREETRELDM